MAPSQKPSHLPRHSAFSSSHCTGPVRAGAGPWWSWSLPSRLPLQIGTHCFQKVPLSGECRENVGRKVSQSRNASPNFLCDDLNEFLALLIAAQASRHTCCGSAVPMVTSAAGVDKTGEKPCKCGVGLDAHKCNQDRETGLPSRRTGKMGPICPEW